MAPRGSVDRVVLTDKDLRLLRLSIHMVLGQSRDVAALRTAAPSGEPDRAWREAVLQIHLFAGFPRQIEAYEVLKKAGGLGPLDPDEPRGDPDRVDRGTELFDLIYGDQSETVQTRLNRHHPDFGHWIIGHAYGRVLTRPGLSAAKRELLAIGALAALGQNRQLASHIRGAIRCGWTQEQLATAIRHVQELLPKERYETALEILSHFGQASPKPTAP